MDQDTERILDAISADGTSTVDEVQRAVAGTDPAIVRRSLARLVGGGLVRTDDGKFTTTPLGEKLRTQPQRRAR